MPKKQKIEGRLFTIKAYCIDCHKCLLESNPLTRRELMENWDNAVLQAPNIQCKDCKHPVPNFHIELRICDKRYPNKEYLPSKVLPTPKNPMNNEMMEFLNSKK